MGFRSDSVSLIHPLGTEATELNSVPGGALSLPESSPSGGDALRVLCVSVLNPLPGLRGLNPIFLQ